MRKRGCHRETLRKTSLRKRGGRGKRYRYRLAGKVDDRLGSLDRGQIAAYIGSADKIDGGAFGHARLRPVRRLLKQTSFALISLSCSSVFSP